jgi:hypothetical protein
MMASIHCMAQQDASTGLIPEWLLCLGRDGYKQQSIQVRV